MAGFGIVSLKPQELTWDTAGRLFALRCRSQNLSERTQGLYAGHLGLFRAWLTRNANPPPSEVLAGILRAYLDDYRGRASDQTVDCAFRVLRTFFRFLHRDGLLLLDPMAKVERPRKERRFVKPVTPEQLRLILDQIDLTDALGVRDHALILLLADSGLRLGEALSIRLADVDWSGGSILVMGKGRKERRVAFGQSAKRALLGWMRRRGTSEGAELLICNRYGQALSLCTFEQRFKAYTRRAGIAVNRLSPHALRHFFALSYLKNGGDVMSLQKLLGHTSLTMVRNYVNMTDDDALSKHRQASPLDRLGIVPGSRRVVVR